MFNGGGCVERVSDTRPCGGERVDTCALALILVFRVLPGVEPPSHCEDLLWVLSPSLARFGLPPVRTG